MLSYESYAMILGLKRIDPKHESGPLLVFVDVPLPEATSAALHQFYGTRHALVSATDLATMNSDYASTFILTHFSFQEPTTYKELWRVAKEGSLVYVLHAMTNGGVVGTCDIKNSQDYGVDLQPGIHSCWPYSKGFVRKDTAKHFRS